MRWLCVFCKLHFNRRTHEACHRCNALLVPLIDGLTLPREITGVLQALAAYDAATDKRESGGE